MIRFRVLLPVLSFVLPAAAQQVAVPSLPEGAPPAIAHIDAEELLRHAAFLAADERGGRLTGTPGQEAAARYIADYFAALGLEPWGDPVPAEEREAGSPDRTFLQSYPVTRTSLREGSGLRIGERQWRAGLAVLAEPGDLELELPIRFVGLGRTRGSNAEIAEGEDLSGVLPLAVVKTPRGRVDNRLTVEQQFLMSFSTLSAMGRTAANLAERGARAVVFVVPEDTTGLMDVLTYSALLPGKPMLAPRFKEGGGDISAMLGGITGGAEAPMLVLTPRNSESLLRAVGIGPSALAEYLESRKPEDLPAAAPKLARFEIGVRREEDAVAHNVVALLRGRDPRLADEALIYSAHMDHVGVRMDGDVFNGADDNASGTSGLLEIAQAWSLSEEKPRRSILFLAVSGEELGLWGSEYYAENPTWPLDRIVANLNTDMIGRSGPESGPMEVTVTPSFRHEAFSSIVRDAAEIGEHLGMSFAIGDKYYRRSDHYNFAVKGIPVVFFCNGEHEDYHQVSDEPDKLDGAKMQRIARLAFWTGWRVAGREGRPEVLGPARDWR